MPFLSFANATSIQDSHLRETTYATIQVGDTILQEKRFGHTYEIHIGSKPEPILAQLSHQTLSTAIHDSGARSNPPRCHPSTRRSVLKAIEEWAYNPRGPTGTSCLWLSGPAGAGKSAIAQTLSETWRAQHLLAASFFFPQVPTSRIEKLAVITTIAYQLSVWFPHFLPYIESAINNDPLILSKSPESQIQQLIIQPLRLISRFNSPSSYATGILVIDGLDRWGNIQDEREILSLLVDALTKYDLPLILFITSRPEPHIYEVFDTLPNQDTVLQLTLDDGLSAEADIDLFVRHRFNQLKGSRHQAVGSGWPPKDAIATIMQRTSGQFLYASAVVQHVCRPLGDAQQLLQAIVDGKHEGKSPFAEVDAVFKQILQTISPSSIGIVMDVLAWLSVYRDRDKNNGFFGQLAHESRPISLPWFEHMLHLQPEKIRTHLISLHSLVDVPGRGTPTQPLRVYHECLFEFLSDPMRAGLFFMGMPQAHSRIAKCLSRHLFQGVYRSSETSYNLDVLEERFRFHLFLSCPTRELRKNVVGLFVLQSSDTRHRSHIATAPESRISCDTKRAVLCYLEKCNEAHGSPPFCGWIAKARLALFWSWNVYLRTPCRRLSCSRCRT